jgi:hypothetical protein
MFNFNPPGAQTYYYFNKYNNIYDNVTNACTNFTNVVIRIMREDESKGGCNPFKIRRSRVIGDSFPEFGHIDSWK